MESDDVLMDINVLIISVTLAKVSCKDRNCNLDQFFSETLLKLVMMAKFIKSGSVHFAGEYLMLFHSVMSE